MFLYLRFDFAEGFFAARTQMFVAGGGVQRTGGKSEIQGQRVFVFARNS